MEWTAVPKAPVNENCKTVTREDEIGATDERTAPAPSRDAEPTQNLNQFQFGSLIASAADPGHDLGSLRFGEDIGHVALSALALRGGVSPLLQVSVDGPRVTPHKRRRQRIPYHLRGGELSSAE